MDDSRNEHFLIRFQNTRLFTPHFFTNGNSELKRNRIFGLTHLQVKVLRAVAGIPFGSTSTYGQLANMAGISGAARFVGTALSKNPFPLLVPCHRVIRKDGTTGGFSVGADIKQQLIKFEKKVFRHGCHQPLNMVDFVK